MGQQEESVAIGMWMFLAQEIMFFGGLFTAYLVFRSRFPMAFAEGSNHLDAFWGGLNTLVLIVSSLTMALTVFYAQRANRNMQVLMIVLTMIFGTVFLGVKVIEYTDKYNSGLVPVTGWNKKVPGERTAGEATVVRDAPIKFCRCLSKRCTGRGAADGEKQAYANPRGEFQWNYGNASCARLRNGEGEQPFI
jgi:hypothetical protein